MKLVKITEVVMYCGTDVEAGEILLLPVRSAQALVDEGKAVFVELESEEN